MTTETLVLLVIPVITHTQKSCELQDIQIRFHSVALYIEIVVKCYIL